VAPTVFYGTKDHNSLNLLRLGSASPVDDLFSLGSTLLELQMGSLPWSEDPDAASRGGTVPVEGSGSGGGGGGAGAAAGGPFGPRALAAAAVTREETWGLAVRMVRGCTRRGWSSVWPGRREQAL
jgi:serine/threonine protein kinase